MPQGRKKVPFSGKAKKEQLKTKRHTKTTSSTRKPVLLTKSDEDECEASSVQKINYQSSKGNRMKANRYALQFHKETKEEIENRKQKARESLVMLPETSLEVCGDDFFPKELDFPVRPVWSYDMPREQLEARENRYFTEYVSNIEKAFDQKELSFFEMNLETWRQLWRVLEMSDIVLYIVDIRFSSLMFPPSLYDYVTKELKKDFILVLNKIDLAPAPLVAAWKNYFQQKYPQLHIVMFTTLPSYNLIGKQSDKSGLQVRRRRGRIRMAAEGTQSLFDVVKSIAKDQVDLALWQNKIKEEINEEYDEDTKVDVGETIELKSVDTAYYEHEKYKNGIVTIGCIGHPNVGKSSLMNAVMGKKVVSVSKTPGHTKHFQTIFLTPNVKLCDCPGLVFPSKVPKELQVLMGSFPIAQLREPFTTVKYVAERLDLPRILRIEHPDNDETWSAMDVCDGWAKKRGFLTAKAARLDSYRAANHLLRMTLDGKICLCLRPPEYSEKKEFWNNHPDIEKVKWIQARSDQTCASAEECDLFTESDDEAAGISRPNPKLVDPANSSSGEEEESDGSEDETVGFSANKFAALDDEQI